MEAGRWVKQNRVPIHERKCSFCNIIEDEYHFVIQCAAYSELREKYISNYFWKRPNMFKFVESINSSNINYIRKLCILYIMRLNYVQSYYTIMIDYSIKIYRLHTL